VKKKVIRVVVLVLVCGLGFLCGLQKDYYKKPMDDYIKEKGYIYHENSKNIVPNKEIAEQIVGVMLKATNKIGNEPLKTTYDRKRKLWKIEGEYDEKTDLIKGVIIYRYGEASFTSYHKKSK
jgi:hypothetical protein